MSQSLELEQRNARALCDLISNAGYPHIERTTPIRSGFRSLMPSFVKRFKEPIGRVARLACSHKSERYLSGYGDSVAMIFASLIAAAFQWKHLSVPKGDESGTYNNQIGLTRRHGERIMEALVEDGWCDLTRPGFKHHGNPSLSRGTQYYPLRKTIAEFAYALYEEAGDFDNYQPYKYPDDVSPWDVNQIQTEKVLRQYNEMMREHSWAFKAPTTRTCGSAPFTSGRVVTPFQNIANRRIPIRQNTLLDGKPLVEVDFQANHPYLLSKLSGESYDGDFYEPITKLTGLTRTDVKRVITACIGAKNKADRNRIAYSLYDIGTEDIDKVVDTTYKLYPWIPDRGLFFSNQGTKLQWLEGEIAIGMFEFAVNNNIPLVCVHDAYACNLEHQSIVHSKMHALREMIINLTRAA